MMKIRSFLVSVALVLAVGCVAEAPDAEPAPAPETATDVERAPELDPMSDDVDVLAPADVYGACGTFDTAQDDLWCSQDSLGFVCCNYRCVGCSRPAV